VWPVTAKRKRSMPLYSRASLDGSRTGLLSTHSVPFFGIGACGLSSKTFFCQEVLV
jgi:hypothetical protein